MKNEQMLKLRYETDMPADDQIYCYLSCNVRINKGELKKNKKTVAAFFSASIILISMPGMYYSLFFVQVVELSKSNLFKDMCLLSS